MLSPSCTAPTVPSSNRRRRARARRAALPQPRRRGRGEEGRGAARCCDGCGVFRHQGFQASDCEGNRLGPRGPPVIGSGALLGRFVGLGEHRFPQALCGFRRVAAALPAGPSQVSQAGAATPRTVATPRSRAKRRELARETPMQAQTPAGHVLATPWEQGEVLLLPFCPQRKIG